MSKNENRARLAFICIAVALLTKAQIASAADYRVLHTFTGGTNDGAGPMGSLIQSGSILYGMTVYGGSSGNSAAFQINADGTDFQLLHSFVSAGNDGINPGGSLLLSGSTLYGLGTSEGSSYGDTLFRMDINGADFQVLRRFSGSDGVWPYTSLILSDSILYGMNTFGGIASGYNGNGTVYKINTNGSGFQLLHTFTSGANDGQRPHGSLVQSGSILYGMTVNGGASYDGTIFRVNTNGTGFQLLHSFTGGDGIAPMYSLSLSQSGSILYGTTTSGGNSNNGAAFRMNTDATGFLVLHNFAGGGSDGARPFGELTECGGLLYGMTCAGGASGNGAIFSMKTDGTDYQLLHSFNGDDGSKPYGSLYLSNSTLYGMTCHGGSYDQGVIFALTVPEPSSIVLMTMGGLCLLWRWRRCGARRGRA